MPIRVPEQLPAIECLREERIFVMEHGRAESQDIRPLEILVINLMPRKEVTETQLLRVLSNTPLQINVTFLHTATYQATHTELAYLHTFYKTFDEVKGRKFDGLIITGAPVECMPFEEVAYWDELLEILDWAKDHVFSTLYLCWAAQAGVYYNYGVNKVPLDKKMFGIFSVENCAPVDPLLRGFDDYFNMPHSRHTGVEEDKLGANPEVQILGQSKEAGLCIAKSRDNKHVFVFGHPEYDVDTLRFEYERDRSQGLPIEVPVNYFPDDDPSRAPHMTWRSAGMLLYTNWLNYYVYQETPYNFQHG